MLAEESRTSVPTCTGGVRRARVASGGRAGAGSGRAGRFWSRWRCVGELSYTQNRFCTRNLTRVGVGVGVGDGALLPPRRASLWAEASGATSAEAEAEDLGTPWPLLLRRRRPRPVLFRCPLPGGGQAGEGPPAPE